MVTTEVEIWNLALSHLNISKEVASESERSSEATACARFYPTAIETTLRDFPWPFATQIEPLTLIPLNPSTEWEYAYRYPTKCVCLRRILGVTRNDSHQSRIPYRVVRGIDSVLIYTDMINAQIEYTYLEEDVTRYSADFVSALSYRLAAYLAPRLTGGDPFKLGDRALLSYRMELGRAQSNSENEQVPDQTLESEFVRERDA